MKIFRLFLLVLATTMLLTPVVRAQGTGEAANITNLMGERPGNTYYQNPSTGAETQGTTGVTDSAGASILQQLPATKLTVEAAPISAVVAPAKQNSSSWKLLTVLTVVFLAAAAVLFVLGMKKQKATLEAEMTKQAAEEARGPKSNQTN